MEASRASEQIEIGAEKVPEKETINVNKIVVERKETINIQGDMIVPDSKPDILNTINTSGNVSIYKKEILEGKVRIDGNIITHIMYLADVSEDNQSSGIKDNVRGLNTTLDFSETINIGEIELGMEVDINPKIKYIECKVLNGRKITIKVTMDIEIKAYEKETIDIIKGFQEEEIQILEKNMKINSLVGAGNTRAYVKENIIIPNSDNLAEILYAQIDLVDKDIKISYNKILAKSEVEIKMAYLTEDGRICKNQSRIPLVGFIDMPNIKEENICETSYMIKNIIIKPNSIEEHSVYIEIEVEISCMAYEEKNIRIIQDMYCPGKKINFNQKMVNTITNKQSKKNLCSIREKINIPEIINGNIVDVSMTPKINKQSRMNERIIYEGEVEVNIMFTDTSIVGINTKKVNLPFELTVSDIDENCKVNTSIEVNSQEFLTQGEIVNANIDLNLETSSYRNVKIPVINNVTTEEQEDLEDYSVIIYVVKRGDTLWEIAKRYGSTVDDIVRVNGIENPDKIRVSEKIYIPKYVLKRSKEPISI